MRVGIAGAIGFGGGFDGATASDFGEREMKSFVERSRREADGLADALAGLDCRTRIALTHYSPIADTLEGERREIYPFLGSHLLADAIDRTGADLALHGHAHRGDRMRHHTGRRAGPQRGDARDPSPVLPVHDRHLIDRTVLHDLSTIVDDRRRSRPHRAMRREGCPWGRGPETSS